MARQSELLVKALAATPRDVGRLVRPASAGRPQVEALLAGLVEEERRTRAVLAAAGDPSASASASDPESAPDTQVAGAARLAERFAEERARTLRVLAALPVGGWSRPATHPERGELRVHALVRWLVDRDTSELARLAELSMTTDPHREVTHDRRAARR